MKRRVAILASGLVALILVATCRQPETAAPAHDNVPVFIISIDTLRSDHLPAYGYRGVTTPVLDRFRHEAILFQRAFSHCPQTLPSHTTLLTGLLPPDNGVRDNIGYNLGESIPTLPELLKQNGYVTGAAVSTYVLRRWTGVGRGFDLFDDEMDPGPPEAATSSERNGDRTRETLERWLAQTSGRRVFGFLHLYEPHTPYAPPPAFKRFAPYDGEIAYADSIVGKFFDALKQRGLYDDALIIVLSDHGEGLNEHGEAEHGLFLYRESIQVPLFVKLPHGERGGTSSSAPVGLTDIAPTILRYVGVTPPSTMHGADLTATSGVASGRSIYSETYFPRLHFGWHELTSLIAERYHAIDAPRRELYDYVADPRERRNIADENRRTLSSMTGELQQIPQHFAPPSSVDPEDQRKLAALGYVGSSAGTAGGDLPDPKDRIRSLQLFRGAYASFSARDDAKAIAQLQRLVKEDPNVVDAWGLLARSYRRRGKQPEALAALRTAMQRFPNDPNVALALADLLFSMGDYDGARAHAQLAVSGNATLAHEALARMALERGDLDEADRQGSQAVAQAPNRSTTLRLLASIRKKQKRFDDELSLLDRAAGEIEARHLPPVPGLQFDRGEALLELGRGPESEEAFAAETRTFPEHIEAWGSLAAVRAAKGDRAGALATVQELLQRNPTPAAARVAADTYEALGDHAAAVAARRRVR